MSELSDRMRRQLDAKPGSIDAPQPFVTAPPTYERRVTLDLTADDHQALKLAAVTQRTTMADLLRALVAVWREDTQLAQRIRDLLQAR
jgi:hypothetical protein